LEVEAAEEVGDIASITASASIESEDGSDTPSPADLNKKE